MSFAEFIREALCKAALPTTRNKGSVKPIRPVTPRRLKVAR